MVGHNRQTQLMQWYNFLGTIVSAFDLILVVFGMELLVICFVNDFNADIKSDINYHFHYGVGFAGLVLMIASLVGFAGFLKESLAKLTLSWALMIFVVLLLCQSLWIVYTYDEELSLLINSEAEIAFTNLANIESSGRLKDKYKRKSDSTMKEYDCCGWDRTEDMIFNHQKWGQLLPCLCCHKHNDEAMKNCTENSGRNPTKNDSICWSNSSISKPCKDEVEKAFSNDLTVMKGMIIFIIVLILCTIFISIRLSNSLLTLFNASD